ncbi:hypothetical protein TKK_0018771 [Trichogramma kaykai]
MQNTNICNGIFGSKSSGHLIETSTDMNSCREEINCSKSYEQSNNYGKIIWKHEERLEKEIRNTNAQERKSYFISVSPQQKYQNHHLDDEFDDLDDDSLRVILLVVVIVLLLMLAYLCTVIIYY